MFFKKKKPYLKDLIPEGFVDIHSHLLFGIDDGAETFDDSLKLTKSLIDIGFAEFITTPHTMQYVWPNSTENIIQRNDETVALLRHEAIMTPFKSASEYLIDDDLAKRIKEEPLLTIKDNYVLVEMSYLNPPMQLYDIIFDLQVAGYIPILAHPERYIFYHRTMEEYDKLKKAGCLFQLNLLAAVGYYGYGVTLTCENLLKQGMYDFVGSDVHHQNHVGAFENRLKIKNPEDLVNVLKNNQIFKQE